MNILGIDQSLTSTGLIVLNDKVEIVHQELVETKVKDFDLEIERLIHIKNKVWVIAKQFNIEKAYMEGFSFKSKGHSLFQLGGIGYLIRELFYDKKIPLFIVEPTKLKKFVTGKGQCKKELILLKVFKKWGIEFDSNDLADAYSLARYGLENLL